jgi:C-terminal processing protease CtpA/Prc
MEGFIMKRLIFIILLLVLFSGELVTGETQDFQKFVQNAKKKIITKRSYKIGSEENIVLSPGQATHLDFEENSAGVKEFIFYYDDETLDLIWRFIAETEEQYTGTSLDSEKRKSYRGIYAEEVSKCMWIFYEFEPKDGMAFVKFRSTEQLSEKDREEIKEIEDIRRRRNAANTREGVVAKLRENVTQEMPYEFGTVTEVTIIPEKNAVRLICSDNPEGVEEILIGATPQHLFIYCVLSTGSITGGGGTWAEGPGSFRQVGGSAAIGMWECKDEKISVKFQLTDDDNAIIQSYRELEKAGKSFPNGRFSKMIKDWGLLFDDTELIFPRLTPAQRVEAFTRLWSTVKFNFANFDLVPELNWEDVLSEYLPKVIQDQSNDEYILLLKECIARLKDGHTSISSSWGNGLRAACPPLRILSVEGKAVITQIGETDEIKASGIKPGDEITHIDGCPVRELLEKDIYPYICASTSQGRDLNAYPRILCGPKQSKVSLSLKTLEGLVRNVTLTRRSGDTTLLPRSHPQSILEYRDLRDDLVYVALNSFGSNDVVQAFNEKFREIRQAKGLIIDVRKNGGGSSRYGHEIIAHLIDKAIPTTRWKTPQYRAAFRAWGRDEQWYDGGFEMIEPETTEPFLGPVVVLIGPETNSAAEDFVVPLHASGRAAIIGQRSRGSTGQPLQFRFLDGNIFGRVCTKRDQYPDGRDFVGAGIIPDVEVHPTPNDIAACRDVVLEKGLEVLRAKIN